MKKTILIWTLLLVAGIGTSFAAGTDDGTWFAKNSFKKEFSNASVIRWDNYKAFTKATFTMNGRVLYAYYTNGGELLAVAGNILSDRLPVTLQTELKKNYSGYWVTDLFEVASEGETDYYITIENPDYVLVLKSNGSDEWSMYSRKKKAVE